MANDVKRVNSQLQKEFNMNAGILSSAFMQEARAGSPKMSVLWFSDFLNEEEFETILNTDFARARACLLDALRPRRPWRASRQSTQALALFSFLFVWFWIRVHVGSCTVASLSMLQILISLPLSLFIYYVVFQISYFGAMDCADTKASADILDARHEWTEILRLVPVVDIRTGNATTRHIYHIGHRRRRRLRVLGRLAPEQRGRSTDCRRGSRVLAPAPRGVRVYESFGGHIQHVLCSVNARRVTRLDVLFSVYRSFTTAVAFFATATSKIMPISTFGTVWKSTTELGAPKYSRTVRSRASRPILLKSWTKRFLSVPLNARVEEVQLKHNFLARRSGLEHRFGIFAAICILMNYGLVMVQNPRGKFHAVFQQNVLDARRGESEILRLVQE